MRGVSVIVPLGMIMAGCAGPIETRISSTGEEQAVAGSFMLASLPEDSATELAAAQALLVQGLTEKGYRLANDADMVLTVGISDRPAQLAVKNGSRILSPAKRPRLLQNCADREYRMTIELTRKTDGTRLYSGNANEYHCKASLTETLPSLAKRLIADIERPRGAKSLVRLGRD